ELDLTETAVTDAGLKHLKGLTRIESAGLPPACETEGALHTLHDLGLLHLFPRAVADTKLPARKPADVTTVYLTRLPITTTVLNDLKALPALARIGIKPEQVTDEALRAVADLGWVHRLYPTKEVIGLE